MQQNTLQNTSSLISTQEGDGRATQDLWAVEAIGSKETQNMNAEG